MSDDRLPGYDQIRLALEEIPIAMRAARRLRGLTVHEAGSAAGMEGSTFWRIERGEGYSRESLLKILVWLADAPE